MAKQLAPGSYYGQTLRSRSFGSFELSERVYSPRFQTPKHTHKQALFCFVMEGCYTEIYGSRTRECTPSMLLFHPPGELHAERFHDTGGRSFLIEISPNWLTQMREHLKMAEAPAAFRGGPFSLLSRRLHREFAEPDAASPLIIEGLLMELLGETLRHGRPHPDPCSPRWLRQARDLFHSRFTENLTLAEVAQSVGIHPVHLAQTFQKTYHCTIGEYVRKLRIEFACHELVTSSKPIVEIALAAGFCDQSHFTRTFKKVIGMAPSEYRNSLR